MAASNRPPSSLRTIIVIIASIVWGLSEFLPVLVHGAQTEPGIGEAYMAVLAAALAFPEIDKFRNRNRKRDDEHGDDGETS
jgi:hypothetical protein